MSDSLCEDETSIIGINLASEVHSGENCQDVTLGVIPVQLHVICLDRLRELIKIQLHAVPSDFTFLTKEGWPVGEQQEASIKVKQAAAHGLVRIKRNYDKPRVGIRLQNGTAVGFVFIEYCSSVKNLRAAIKSQLGHICSVSGNLYQFLDRNSWPLTFNQEDNLAVIDLLQNSTVLIVPPEAPTEDFTDALEADPVRNKRQRLSRALTYQISKDERRTPSTSVQKHASPQPKQILISYVRNEAAQHAVKLKTTLIDLGCCSVYLDVHEIKSGVDWADSLNFAVLNCEIFVTLVTPHYGETQWTNREVKLADMLSKLIIPVSFVDEWPPKCLAIQFATTQFIPWKANAKLKPHSEDSLDVDKLPDISLWGDEELKAVAEQVVDRVQVFQNQTKTFPSSQLTRKKSTLRSCPFSLPDEFLPLSQHRDGRPLVILSLHPEQAEFGNELKNFLGSVGYEVWCSTELTTKEATCTIQDDKSAESEEELFSQEDKDVANTSSDTETCLSQLSQMSMSQGVLSGTFCEDREMRLRFQAKTDEAGVVIFVMSSAFAKSRNSRMQVFYCEHRKRVIAIKYEDFYMPSWISMLIGTGNFEDAKSKGFHDNLQKRIKDALDKDLGSDPDTDEETINEGINELRQQVPKGFYVYISGSTQFYNPQSSNICRAIGKKLATIDDIFIATGGFEGVGQTSSQAYVKERSILRKDANLWHILPHKDDKHFPNKQNQMEDGTFTSPESGTTVFCGKSVRDRETIVSRFFDLCILIEGGPGSAHEAEQFCWSGHVVVPIRVTGGAAGGKFSVPDKIFKKPCGVSCSQWEMLSNKAASPRQIANAVLSIVTTLKQRMQVDSPSYTGLKPPLMQTQPTMKVTYADDIHTTSHIKRPNIGVSPGKRKLPEEEQQENIS